MQADDLVRVKQIQDKVYPDIGGWRMEQLESQLRIFPQGQLVACIGERVVGAASSLIVKWDTYGISHTYKEVTGGACSRRTIRARVRCTGPKYLPILNRGAKESAGHFTRHADGFAGQ